MIGLLPVLLAAFVAAAPTPAAFRIAVIVGRNDGGPGREVLRWAHKDAESIAAVMGELGGIPDADRILLVEPDKRGLDAALALVQMRLASISPDTRSELFFYYSGHADELGLMLGADRYAFRDLRARLDAIPVDLRLVIVDACASGALIGQLGQRNKGGKRTAPFLGDGDLSGHAYLTSGAADEIAQESDALEASFFTHDLITGLRGAADRDRDRTVSLTEAYRYAFDATLARTQATRSPQHPGWDIALTGAGDVVLTRLDQASARLILAANLKGRFFVRGAREVLVAELQKDAGDSLELALPPGTWRVATNKAGRRLEADASIADGAPFTLSTNDFRDVGPALDGRARGASPIRVRVSLIPLVGFEGLGDDVVVHGVSLSLLGDRILVIRGAQLTTLFNVADEVTGAQIGLVNIGGTVRGAQIGLVNIADSLEGASLALFPWVGGPEGLHHLEIYGGTDLPLNIGWRVGARWLHTAVSLGTDFTDCELGIAVGTEVDLAPLVLGFDLGPRLGARRCDPGTLGGKTQVALRTILGVRVFPAVMIFAAGSAAVDVDDGVFTPGVVGGLRFFR